MLKKKNNPNYHLQKITPVDVNRRKSCLTLIRKYCWCWRK